MRIPFLILCLAVVYGACRTYEHEKNIDLNEEIQNNGNYKLDYPNMPVEKFLSRNKRHLSLKKITTPPTETQILRLFNGFDVISTTIDLTKFIFDVMIEQNNMCSKVEKLSFPELIPESILRPIEATKIVICYIFQEIGEHGRALGMKIFYIAVQFLINVFLPGLHTTLNAFNRTGLLPEPISFAILMFDLIYKCLQIFGYLPK